MFAEQDDETIAQMDTSKRSEILVHIEDVCITTEILEILMKDFPQNSSEQYLDDKVTINMQVYFYVQMSILFNLKYYVQQYLAH